MEKLVENHLGKLLYNGYDLFSLAQKYSTPLKVTFLDVIRARVTELKKCFDKAIEENGYEGKFIYLNANKANYSSLEIETAFLAGDGLETSSNYDLLYTESVYKKFNETEKPIVCNGYKDKAYLDNIIRISKNIKIIDIIDSLDEYNTLKKQGVKLEVGLRLHMSSLYEEHDDRFGITIEEFNYIINDISNTNLVLTTIHFHQRGFDYIESKFLENISLAFNYYCQAKTKVLSVCNFDMGGGTPLPTDYSFDYDAWANLVIRHIQSICAANNVSVPNLLSENGKYSQKDSTVNIYKVCAVKATTKDYPWYLVDGSLLIAMPEYYALGEPIKVVPISNLGKPMIKARLGGITCDCDDVFQESNGYIMMPKDTKDLYIALLGTGSYQNSMNGKRGVHHCLLPEEKDVVISNGKEFVRHDIQGIDEIIELMK